MKLAIITDAWAPQVNGVVRTLETTIAHLGPDYDTHVIEPSQFMNFPMPGYSEIRLSLPWGVWRRLNKLKPDHVHIATEGPLGWAARLWCLARRKQYSTSYHTQFPEYLHTHYKVPMGLTYSILRAFHNSASSVMVNTPSMMERLAEHGFKNLKIWSRGVDVDLFKTDGSICEEIEHLPRPVWINVGRVSAEKNLEEFYKLELVGTKVQVGRGPQLEEYQAKYPDVVFVGNKSGEDLAAAYRSADVFVFPSKTDTFGLVMLEAMATGLPVAAFNVTGPKDVVINNVTGRLEEDQLWRAAYGCLTKDSAECIAHAHTYSWDKCTQQFKDNLVS